jgi:3-oxoacyl-[acyl-carrier protein] reductase
VKFKHKTVLITGAGRGIGFAIAEEFLTHGANIIVIDINVDLWEGLKDNANVHTKEFNLFEQDKIPKLIDDLWEVFPEGIDILINNAGINRDSLLLKMDEQQWDEVFEINLRAPFLLTATIGKKMKDHSINGSIVNIVSTAGKHGNFGQANYAASKAGLLAFTKTAARELARFNIRVNAVMPGLISTPMTTNLPEKIITKRIDEIPLKRPGEPYEVAKAVSFLASSEASYITGTVIRVDGGLRM